jgi:anhydro-N-acetylmuramic acid kinase
MHAEIAHSMQARGKKKHRRFLGIMSGTSLDGVDYALCEMGQGGLRLIRLWSHPFPAALRQRLHDAASNVAPSYETGQLHHDLGRFYAKGAMDGLRGVRPDGVGLHGQTIYHNPDRRSPATLQIGEPAYLVEALRVPVVSNFRSADIAAGGQGAPLATMFHKEIFAAPGLHVCVNNLGGISNVTSLDWRRRVGGPRVTAFDTGPGNVLMDMASRHISRGKRVCDRGGVWAARGTADTALISQWLGHPYFRKSPPKSTGREVFGEPFFRHTLAELRRTRAKPEDILANFTEFTARSILLNYRLHLPELPDRVILTGGGASNPVLVKMIRRELKAAGGNGEVLTSRELGWPVQAIEAAAFALLASLRLEGRPGNLPGTTGAGRAVLCGQVTEV